MTNSIPRVSFAFFATGALFVLIGMGLGMYMGASQDRLLAPVHAHLNLIGWASMGLMGAFYAFAGDKAPRRLSWINYGLMTASVVLMTPALAAVLRQDARWLPVLITSEVLAVAGMASFFAAVLMTWNRTMRPAVNPLASAMPAE